MNSSDADLVLRIQAGDLTAFEELVRRYQNPLVNFVCRYLGDRWSAEDVTQEVFLKVHRFIGRFEVREEIRMSTWLFTIAYRHSLNELKRRKRRRFLLDLLQVSGRQSSGSDAPSGAPGLKERIAGALAGLPERQRAAMVLLAFEGLSYQEIGQVIEASPAAVESLIFRARKRLRQILKEESAE